MRFLHTADIHLGVEPDLGKSWSGERRNEIWHTFERIINIAKEQQVDLLLIAGDLFHRQPLMRELKEVNYLFSSLAASTRVVFILGNHDYVKKDSYYHQFIWNENVTCLIGKDLERVYFKDINTEVYGFSYHSKIIKEPLYDNIRPDHPGHINLLLAHGGDAEHIPISKSALAAAGFDYTALGHIHKPESIIENKIIYAGAPEPLDINDTGVHGYILGEVNKRGVSARFRPLACRSYVHAVIDIEPKYTAMEIRKNIETKISTLGQQNIYKIILQGYVDPDLNLDLEYLESVGNITEIVDHTEKAYDIQILKQSYRGNIIARYIEELEGSGTDAVRRKAMSYGIRALMEAKK